MPQTRKTIRKYQTIASKYTTIPGRKSFPSRKYGVRNYAEKAVSWAVAKGVISGNILPNGKKAISPFDNATRAEVAAMMEKYCKNVGR